jgi:hypothetical protein
MFSKPQGFTEEKKLKECFAKVHTEVSDKITMLNITNF